MLQPVLPSVRTMLTATGDHNLVPFGDPQGKRGRRRVISIFFVPDRLLFAARHRSVRRIAAAVGDVRLSSFGRSAADKCSQGARRGIWNGFPLVELAERLGLGAEVHGVDVWTVGLQRCREKVEARATPNIHIHETSARNGYLTASPVSRRMLLYDRRLKQVRLGLRVSCP